MSACWSAFTPARRVLILGLAVFLLFGAFGCSSDDDDDGGTTPAPDTTAPPDVSSFLALPADGQVTLSWTLPISSDLAGVRIRRATDAAPTATTGELIYDGTAAQYVDSSVTNDQTYYYGAFTYDSAGNLSAGQTDSCMPRVGVGVTISDGNLELALRQELGVPSGDITDLQMESLLELDVGNLDIADLQGLQHATNLYDLDLGNNLLGDDGNLQLLAQLTNLRDLDLTGNAMTIVPDLTALTALVSLRLIDNPITSLSPLSGLTSLTDLEFGLCDVSDLTPLQGLTSLRSLYFQDCNVTSLAPLGALTSLESLQVAHCAVSSLDVVAQLPQLLHLGVNAAEISDLTPLADRTQLVDLALSGNGISDLTPLANLTNLTILQVGSNQIRDVSPIAGLTGLESLQIGWNPIVDISPLSGLTEMKYFGAIECWISDLSVLSGWTELISAGLFGCAVGTESIQATLPALVAAGVDVDFEYDTDFLPLLGVWKIGGATVNGSAVEPRVVLEWDAETVTNHLIVFPWGAYRAEELDADGLPVYSDSGNMVLDGDSLIVQALVMDGVDIWPPEEVFAGTWSKDGTDLVLTSVVGGDTVVLTWVR